MNKVIVWNRIWLGLGCTLIGLVSVGLGSGSLIGTGMFFIVIGILFFVFSKSIALYCADCGQYMGSRADHSPRCPRCGCNVFTRGFNGVGRTTRNR